MQIINEAIAKEYSMFKHVLQEQYALDNYKNMSDIELLSKYCIVNDMDFHNIYESAHLDYSKDKIKDALINRIKENNSFKWNYADAPYFTEAEIGYILNEHFHRDENQHDANFHRVDPEIYRNKIVELQELMKKTEDPELLSKYKEELISLGWNPAIDYNDITGQKAQERIASMYQDEMAKMPIIDCSSELESIDEEMHSNINNAINIIVYESGKNKIIAGEIDSLDESGLCEIYSMYYTGKIDINECESIGNKTSFNLPMNCRASLIANKYNSFDILIKTYSGLAEQCDINSINEYNKRLYHNYDYISDLYYKATSNL